MDVSLRQHLLKASPYHLSARVRRPLLVMLCVLAASSVLASVALNLQGQIAVGMMALLVTALAPSFLWCAGRAHGIPIFPIYALYCYFAYGFPFIFDLQSLAPYTPAEKLAASLQISAFLLVGCVAWISFAGTVPLPPRTCLSMRRKEADYFFFAAIVALTAYTILRAGGWLDSIPTGMLSIIHAPLDKLGVLAAFVLSFRFGTREIRGQNAIIFLVLLAGSLAAGASQLFLRGPVSTGISAVLGYFLGSRRVPWRLLLIGLSCMVVLNTGKGRMREEFWYEKSQRAKPVQIWELHGRYAEWMAHGIRILAWERKKAEDTYSYNQNKVTARGEESIHRLVDRIQLMYLFLRVQRGVAEEGIPYLLGATYLGIPELWLPRLVHPDKPNIHENTRLLNKHFGNPVNEHTVVGWGLLNEAYGNFGLAGCLLFGATVGAAFGALARWSLFTPILSARGLFAIAIVQLTILLFESNTGIAVKSLLQIGAGMAVLSACVMERCVLSMPLAVAEPGPRGHEAREPLRATV